MILGPIEYVDCLVFILCLIPQLLLWINWVTLILTALKALPSLGIPLPV